MTPVTTPCDHVRHALSGRHRHSPFLIPQLSHRLDSRCLTLIAIAAKCLVVSSSTPYLAAAISDDVKAEVPAPVTPNESESVGRSARLDGRGRSVVDDAVDPEGVAGPVPTVGER